MIYLVGTSPLASDPLITQLVSHINRLEQRDVQHEQEIKRLREEVESMKRDRTQPVKLDARPLNLMYQKVSSEIPP